MRVGLASPVRSSPEGVLTKRHPSADGCRDPDTGSASYCTGYSKGAPSGHSGEPRHRRRNHIGYRRGQPPGPSDARSVSSARTASQALPEVDVVIVAFNGAGSLSVLIPELLVSQGVRARVVVVDNASTDASVEVSVAAGATVIRMERNRGYGAAANVGLAHGSGPWVVIANQDLRVEPDALGALVIQAQNCAERWGCPVVVGPRLVSPEGALHETFHRFPHPLSQSLAFLFGDRLAGDRNRRADRPAHADWVSAAFILGPRRAFESVGGFDPQYFMYVEDVDLFRRLRNAGVVCRWVPDVAVVHRLGSRRASPLLHAHALVNWRRYFLRHHGQLAAEAVFAAGVTGGATHALWWLLRIRREKTRARRIAWMFAGGSWLAARAVWGGATLPTDGDGQ